MTALSTCKGQGVGDASNSHSATGQRQKQNTTRNRNESNPTISKFTGTGIPIATLSKGPGAGNNRARGVYNRARGRTRPRSKAAVPSAPRHHPPSPDCVLCNRLACSTRILQLIAWAVSSGQLCLKKSRKSLPRNHTIPQNSLSSDSQAVLNVPTTELEKQNKDGLKNLFSWFLSGDSVLGGSTW